MKQSTSISSKGAATSLLRLLFVGCLAIFPVHAQELGDDLDLPDCYNTTFGMLQAQAKGVKHIIICPNTLMQVGMPTNTEFSEFIGGDLPLTVIGDYTTIKCGENGSVTNNCTLQGGFVQFAVLPTNPFFPNYTVTSHELIVQGLTFTGELTPVPGLLSSSIVLTASADNMLFEDCLFQNLVTDQVVFIGELDASLQDASYSLNASTTISSSHFSNINYRYEVLEAKSGTTMAIQQSTFDQLEYQEGCGCNFSSVVEVHDANLLMSDSNFSNVEYLSSIVAVYGNESTVSYSNLQGTDLVLVDQSNPDDYCSNGLIVESIQNGVWDECLDLFEEGSSTIMVEDGEGEGYDEASSVEKDAEDDEKEDTVSSAAATQLWMKTSLVVVAMFDFISLVTLS